MSAFDPSTRVHAKASTAAARKEPVEFALRTATSKQTSKQIGLMETDIQAHVAALRVEVDERQIAEIPPTRPNVLYIAPKEVEKRAICVVTESATNQ